MAIEDARIEQINRSFDTSLEACEYFIRNGAKASAFLLPDLRAMCEIIEKIMIAVAPMIQFPNKATEIGRNVIPTIDEILQAVEQENWTSAEWRLRCTLTPLLTFWKLYSQFLFQTGGSEADMIQYHQKEKEFLREMCKQPKEEEDREYTFDISVVVLFYNNQEITKHCIDSVLEHCKGISYELITVNNGSDDETTAWSETLPHEKKIYYPYNMGSSAAGNLIFTTAYQFTDGKYLLYLSNDVVLTKGCVESLIQCMDSNPKNILASPVVNSASNLQNISVPYGKNELQAMQLFAAAYNNKNPKGWQERATVFTILGCMRQWALKRFGLVMSPYFCYDMFADDDMSTKFRRAGYHQILCKNIFAHHYGSATIKESQFDVMNKSRAQFYNKYGIDAWLGRGMEGIYFKALLLNKPKAEVKLLGINPRFGESTLAMKNALIEKGCQKVTVDTITEDPRYLDDMRGLFDNGFYIEDPEFLEGEEKYDYISLEGNLEQCRDICGVVELISKRLTASGLAFIKIKNIKYWKLIQNFGFEGAWNIDWQYDSHLRPDVTYLSPDMLQTLLKTYSLTSTKCVKIDGGDNPDFCKKIAYVLAEGDLNRQKSIIQEMQPSAFIHMIKHR